MENRLDALGKVQNYLDQTESSMPDGAARVSANESGYFLPEQRAFSTISDKGTQLYSKTIENFRDTSIQGMDIKPFADFGKTMGIDTTTFHPIKNEDGTIRDFKAEIGTTGLVRDAYLADTKAVYITQDWNKEFNSTVPDTKIRVHEFELYTFVFEKNDGTYDSVALFGDQTGNILGVAGNSDFMPEEAGFNVVQKIDFLDSATPLAKGDKAVEDKINAHMDAQRETIKDRVFASEKTKLEATADYRDKVIGQMRSETDAFIGVRNTVCARYEDMGTVLQDKKAVLEEKDSAYQSAKVDKNPQDVTAARQELMSAYSDYVSTRDSFVRELPVSKVSEVKESADRADKTVSTYETKNEIVKNVSSFEELANSGSVSVIRGIKLTDTSTLGESVDKGLQSLKEKVNEYNKEAPDGKLEVRDSEDGKTDLGLVVAEDGEKIRVYDEAIEEYNGDKAGVVEKFSPSTKESDFEVGDLRSDYLKDDVIWEEVFKNDKVEKKETDSFEERVDALSLKSDSFNAEYHYDKHINPKGEIAVSYDKVREIRSDVLKEYGISEDKLKAAEMEQKAIPLTSDEMRDAKKTVLKEIPGNEKMYNDLVSRRLDAAKDAINRGEVYASFGQSVESVEDKIKARVNSESNPIVLKAEAMDRIDKEASSYSKGDVAKYQEKKEELIAETKHRIGEAVVQKELGIDRDVFKSRISELRDKTTLQDSTVASIEKEARSEAGFREDRYTSALEQKGDEIRANRVDQALSKEFGFRESEYKDKVNVRVEATKGELKAVADKILNLEERIAAADKFGSVLNRRNTVVAFQRLELRSLVKNYEKLGGQVDKGSFIKSSYTTAERIGDILAFVNTNILETIVFYGVAAIADLFSDKKDDTAKPDMDKGMEKNTKDNVDAQEPQDVALREMETEPQADISEDAIEAFKPEENTTAEEGLKDLEEQEPDIVAEQDNLEASEEDARMEQEQEQDTVQPEEDHMDAEPDKVEEPEPDQTVAEELSDKDNVTNEDNNDFNEDLSKEPDDLDADKSSDIATDEPVEEPMETPVEEPMEEPMETPVEEPMEEPMEEPEAIEQTMDAQPEDVGQPEEVEQPEDIEQSEAEESKVASDEEEPKDAEDQDNVSQPEEEKDAPIAPEAENEDAVELPEEEAEDVEETETVAKDNDTPVVEDDGEDGEVVQQEETESSDAITKEDASQTVKETDIKTDNITEPIEDNQAEKDRNKDKKKDDDKTEDKLKKVFKEKIKEYLGDNLKGVDSFADKISDLFDKIDFLQNPLEHLVQSFSESLYEILTFNPMEFIIDKIADSIGRAINNVAEFKADMEGHPMSDMDQQEIFDSLKDAGMDSESLDKIKEATYDNMPDYPTADSGEMWDVEYDGQNASSVSDPASTSEIEGNIVEDFPITTADVGIDSIESNLADYVCDTADIPVDRDTVIDHIHSQVETGKLDPETANWDDVAKDISNNYDQISADNPNNVSSDETGNVDNETDAVDSGMDQGVEEEMASAEEEAAAAGVEEEAALLIL